MNEKPLVDRMRATALDHEKYEQGGGASMLLNEGADALERAIYMLQRLEWSAELPAIEYRDTVTACPVCRQGSIIGLDASHTPGCELASLLRDLLSLKQQGVSPNVLAETVISADLKRALEPRTASLITGTRKT